MNNLYLVKDAEGENGWILLIAPSRGTARAMYLANYLPEAEFTEPLSIQILAHDVRFADESKTGDTGECMWGADEVYFETLGNSFALEMWRTHLERNRRYPQQRELETFYAG